MIYKQPRRQDLGLYGLSFGSYSSFNVVNLNFLNALIADETKTSEEFFYFGR